MSFNRASLVTAGTVVPSPSVLTKVSSDHQLCHFTSWPDELLLVGAKHFLKRVF